MTQPDYLLKFLQIVYSRMQNGIPAETARWTTRVFLRAVAHQNPSLGLQFPCSEYDPLVSTNEIIAADINGNPILICDPQTAFNRQPSSEHYENNKKIPCYLK